MGSRLALGRVPTYNRKPTGFSNQANEQFKTYPAPIMGWVTNQNLMLQEKVSALIMDNFYPTETGIVPRGGLISFVDVPAACEFLMAYTITTTVEYFACTSNSIYKFDDTDSGNSLTVADVTGQTSSDYSYINMVNSGGSFLKAVNGADSEQMYNGTSWSVPTITGVSTALLSHLWLYGRRVFYIEKDTFSAWYLDIDAIQGAATELPLAAIFKDGGSLLFGTTFSTDSGEGLDDLCVFVTTNGEAAFYKGNPADSTWELQGVYKIGEPIGKNAFFHIGGDPVIATKEGMIPLSSAIRKERAQAKLDSLSYQIEPTYNFDVLNSGAFSRWIVQKWSSKDKLLVAPPLNSSVGKGYLYVKNLKTNAWCRYTGWDVQSLAVMNDFLWVGDTNGNIFKADVGGQDNGSNFECCLAYAFDNLGNDGRFKQVTRLKQTWRFRTNFISQVNIGTDYMNAFGGSPNVGEIDTSSLSAWDVSAWDVTAWGRDEQSAYSIKEKISNITGVGENFSVQIKISSGNTAKLDVELISIGLGYRVGYNLA